MKHCVTLGVGVDGGGGYGGGITKKYARLQYDASLYGGMADVINFMKLLVSL